MNDSDAHNISLLYEQTLSEGWRDTALSNLAGSTIGRFKGMGKQAAGLRNQAIGTLKQKAGAGIQRAAGMVGNAIGVDASGGSLAQKGRDMAQAGAGQNEAGAKERAAGKLSPIVQKLQTYKQTMGKKMAALHTEVDNDLKKMGVDAESLKDVIDQYPAIGTMLKASGTQFNKFIDALIASVEAKQ